MADDMIMEKTEETTVESVPYIVHESALARQERMIKRLWITILLLIALLIGSNIAWIVYEAQFQDIVMTQEATTDGGGNAIVSGTATGDVNNYGEGAADNQN